MKITSRVPEVDERLTSLLTLRAAGSVLLDSSLVCIKRNTNFAETPDVIKRKRKASLDPHVPLLSTNSRYCAAQELHDSNGDAKYAKTISTGTGMTQENRRKTATMIDRKSQS